MVGGLIARHGPTVLPVAGRFDPTGLEPHLECLSDHNRAGPMGRRCDVDKRHKLSRQRDIDLSEIRVRHASTMSHWHDRCKRAVAQRPPLASQDRPSSPSFGRGRGSRKWRVHEHQHAWHECDHVLSRFPLRGFDRLSVRSCRPALRAPESERGCADVLTLDECAHEEEQVRGPLGETAREIRVPGLAVR